MAADLAGIARRAGAGCGARREPLAGILGELEDEIIASVDQWADYSAVSRTDLRTLYRDYQIVAEAAGLRVPCDIRRLALAVQMTVILTTYAWIGAL